MSRLRKNRRASYSTGSEAATIEAIAQMGLPAFSAFITTQTIVVAMNTLIANRTPMRSSYLRPHRVRSASAPRDGDQGVSLIRLGRVAEQPVDGARLGGRQRNPVLGRILQRDEERLGLQHRFPRHLGAVLEADLECEFADERAMLAPRAPDGDVGLRRDPVAEIEQANVLQHLF